MTGVQTCALPIYNGGHYVYDVGSTCADQAANLFLTKGIISGKPLSCPAPAS